MLHFPNHSYSSSCDVCVMLAHLKGLFIDHDTGIISHTKVWNNIANLIMSIVMLRQSIGWEMLLTYGGVVGGNQALNLWLKRKYAVQANTDDK